MNIFIVGGKEEVYFLTKSFLSKGHQLTIINSDKEFSRKISRQFKVNVVIGDGSKPYMLEQSGIIYADIIIALTANDSDNLVICQIASKMYGVARTIAVVNDPNNVSIFKKLGVDTVISTTDIISAIIEQRAVVDDIRNLASIAEDRIVMVEVEVTSDHPAAGKMLSELAFPDMAIIGCVLRQDQTIIPNGKTVIQAEDHLIVIVDPKSQAEVLRIIRGKID